MIPRMTNSRGSVLIICLMTLTVLGVVGLWAYKISSLNRQTAYNQVRQHQAFYLAEAGVGLALASLRGNLLWRGEDPGATATARGALALGGLTGSYGVTLFDATDDNNGNWDTQLPGGVVRLVSEGRCQTAYQALSCRVKLSPVVSAGANSPPIALVSAGPVSFADGTPVTMGYDEYGHAAMGMVRANTALPPVNLTALKALADHAVTTLDNDAFDDVFSGCTGFYRDSPADTQPRITWVFGDLALSGSRRLYGVVFVEGQRVVFSGSAGIHGVLYAPHAREVVIADAGSPGNRPVMGQLLAGAGGVRTTGTSMGVQLVGEYVDMFNEAGAATLDVTVVPGSWHSL